MKKVFITGTSSGIGYATSVMLIRKGYQVFGTVRKQEDAVRLKEELGDMFIPVLCDVSQEDEVKRMALEMKDKLNGEFLDAVVNNAGIAIGGPLLLQPMEEIRYLMEVNLFGTLNVIRELFPLLKKSYDVSSQGGRFINITSTAGHIGYPFLGGYVATKYALEGLSDVLRRELMIYGIKVIVVAPGDTRTPIWEKAEQQDDSTYKNTDYYPILLKYRKMFVHAGKTGLPVEKIAKTIVKAIESPKPSTRYIIPNGRIKWWFLRYFPDRMVDKAIQRIVGLFPMTQKNKL